MEDSTTFSPDDYEDYTIVIQTCQDFLAMNLTRSEAAQVKSDLLVDSCGNPAWNSTFIANHPSKWAMIVMYPIFLFICTVGNILNVIILARDHSKSVKQVYLIALAVSDFLFMWAQFFPYLTNFDTVLKNSGITDFINQITGGTSFMKEMFITSSDWILVVFSLERFLAVVYPLHYSVLISKTRAAIAVTFVFICAALYAMYNLFDYYWFFYNDDPRCPPALLQTPRYIANWHNIQEWAVLIIPLSTFLIILLVNIGVILQLVKQRQFRMLHIRKTKLLQDEGYMPKDIQAIQMLFASVIVYLVTQLPNFVYNVLLLIHRHPFCAVRLSDTFIAKFMRANAVLVTLNYSINFLMYFAISSAFRDGFKEVLEMCRKRRPVNGVVATGRTSSLQTSSTLVP